MLLREFMLMLMGLCLLNVSQAQTMDNYLPGPVENNTGLREQHAPCYFDEMPEKSRRQAEKELQRGIQQYLAGRRNSHDSIKTIPVVMHILHKGGNENINEAQVLDQIRILNEDFGKLPGTNGDGNGVDTDIRFCLAKIDPYGNCTNGIVRIQTDYADHKTSERRTLKELSFWPPDQYLNVYVVRTINGNSSTGGYAAYPGGPPEEDGIVVRHRLVGSIGSASSALGRTTTHEIGHWLGLFHTFNDGCGVDTCLDGDKVCDTPPSEEPNFGCPVNANTCHNDFPDVNNQVRNYMDYSDDNCQNMFTQGQKERAHGSLTAIRDNIWTNTNLVLTGCDSNYVAPITCPVVADFVSLSPAICVGNSVQFYNRSLNDPTQLKWVFPGADSVSSDTVLNPIATYSTVGMYDVTLIASNANGADTTTLVNYITVTEPGIGDSLAYGQDFEMGVYPPQGLTIYNPDGEVTWELDSTASVSGKYSIRINNLINTNYGTIDELILPHQNLTTAHPDSNVYLSFNWAYAKSVANYSDELAVQMSIDCGATFTQIAYKTDNMLATGPTQSTPFVPDSSQWSSDTIDLNAYRNESYVLFKFVNVTDGGNYLYLDDIYVGDGQPARPLPAVGIAAIAAQSPFQIYPNPAAHSVTLKWDNRTQSRVSIFTSAGKLVREFSTNGNNDTYTISLYDMESGLYYLQAVNETGQSFTKKLMVIQ